MMRVEFEMPEDLNLNTQELKMYLAAKLYQDARISSGQGAAIVGIRKEQFILSLGKYGVSYFSDDPEDLANDIANA